MNRPDIIKPPIPEREEERLEAILAHELLSTSRDRELKNLLDLAQIVCDCPIALISIVDRDRQWFKAKAGIEADETPRDIAFCAHAICQSDLMEVPDALIDHRFRDNPLVQQDPNIRFYAGQPLTTAEGHNLGTLCVIDHQPRRLNDEQKRALKGLAEQVIRILELQVANRKLSEQVDLAFKLRKTQGSLLKAIDWTSDGIAVLDTEEKYTYLNHAHVTMFGFFEASELLGKTWREIYSNDEIARFEREVFPILGRDGTWTGEAVATCKDGSTFYEEVSLTLIENAGLICVCRDVSERVAQRENLIKAKEAAQQASQLKSAFMANVSHEIRTPMNGVIGLTHLMREMELPSPADEYIKMVAQSADALMIVINDMLDFSKIEAGMMKVAYEPFLLNDLLSELEATASTTASLKGITFRLVPLEESIEFIGDRGRLSQVLNNLISNAIKFTESGFVELRGSRIDSCWARIEIEDSGIGIPDDVLPNLFQPFVQAEFTTARKFGGTGLGLTISKELIELMGGTISVRSEPGKGSCFSVELPLSAAQ